MILIKLGGSVITDKKEYKRFRKDVVSRLCREIKDSGKEVIIVHGAGSFGHVIAKQYELQKGRIRNDQTEGIAKVASDTRELNNLIVSELTNAGIPSVAVPTGSCFLMDDGKLLMNDVEILQRYMKIGIAPVMMGDILVDRKKEFGICSGDEIMRCLASVFSPEKIIFVSDVDGLYDRDPKTTKNAKLIMDVNEDVLNKIPDEMTVADVTGGVRSKMRTMLSMCSDGRECILVNGTVDGRLRSLLLGEEVVCTKAKK
ncbi:MAG: isopentenyl phosphate kinase [Methanomassiliicoccaceae archaeon]|nr:isopentenyl phosphate kinase [Methanomassiliicoccaceae archaeon]